MKYLNLFFYSLTNLQKLLPMPQLIYGTLFPLLPDTFLYLNSNKENPRLSTSLFSIVLPFSKIQYFLFDKYLIFIMTIRIPSTTEFQLFKPHPIPIYLDFNTDVISSVYMKPEIHYLPISLNNQSYFTTNEDFFNACHQNRFQTFCHPPRILQTKSGCNLDSSTLYYHLQTHLSIMDNSIPASKSITSLAIISPFLYNISIQEPHLLKKVLLLLQQKEDMHYQFSKTMSLSLQNMLAFKKLFHLFSFLVHIN